MATRPRKNSAENSARPARGADGRLRRGNPGNSGGKPGRSGRKPDAFKAMCRGLASHADTLRAVRAILKDALHPQFMAALKWATENGYGRPLQAVEHSGPDGGPIAQTVAVRFVKP
jgi:hypothetical protein